MWWLLIPICLLIVIGFFLWASFYLEINSSQGLFRFRFQRLAFADVKVIHGSFILELKIGWWRRIINVSEILIPEKTKTSRVSKPALTWLHNTVSVKRLKSVIKSFRINRFFLSLDTGDIPANGMLFPVFFAVKKRTGKEVRINFLNENILVLEIENNLVRIIRAIVKST